MADAPHAPHEFDIDAVVHETLRFVAVRESGLCDCCYVGDAPAWFGERLFGGFVVSQAVHAATRTAPPGTRIHSLHGYFLRPLFAEREVHYSVRSMRDGRTFSSRHLVATQEGEAVFEMACSFSADGEGYEYQLAMPTPVPPPHELETDYGPGPWLMARVGPTDPAADGTRASTHRAWMRMGRSLDGIDGVDEHMHAALLGFATDITGIGGRPLRLEGDTTGMVSLDHAVWFHRPWRVDQWALYDVTSVVNTAGRGLLRGTFYAEDGSIVASVAQEMLLRVID